MQNKHNIVPTFEPEVATNISIASIPEQELRGMKDLLERLRSASEDRRSRKIGAAR
jgi:hypothetical protein